LEASSGTRGCPRRRRGSARCGACASRATAPRVIPPASVPADTSRSPARCHWLPRQRRFRHPKYFTVPSGNVAGYFGSLTSAAVKEFQTAHGIKALGGVGARTRALLNSLSTLIGEACFGCWPPSSYAEQAAMVRHRHAAHSKARRGPSRSRSRRRATELSPTRTTASSIASGDRKASGQSRHGGHPVSVGDETTRARLSDGPGLDRATCPIRSTVRHFRPRSVSAAPQSAAKCLLM
jgi:peptidoglycan hydrolase-like protein with peptidoglycan-binding domain